MMEQHGLVTASASGNGGVIRMATSDLDHVIEQYQQAAREFASGDPKPIQRLFSRREDVTPLDPSGGVQRGWEEVSQKQEQNASPFRAGEPSAFERIATWVTPEFAFIVEVERHRGRMEDSQAIVPSTLRVTTIFRMEDGTWKVVHRHADPVASSRPPESAIQ
jgi:ketosteroid isomerase-like protein